MMIVNGQVNLICTCFFDFKSIELHDDIRIKLHGQDFDFSVNRIDHTFTVFIYERNFENVTADLAPVEINACDINHFRMNVGELRAMNISEYTKYIERASL